MAFQALDHENLQVVARSDWANVMSRVTGVKIRWLAMLKSLCSPEALTSKTVNYMEFLSQYTTENFVPRNSSATGNITPHLKTFFSTAQPLYAFPYSLLTYEPHRNSSATGNNSQPHNSFPDKSSNLPTSYLFSIIHNAIMHPLTQHRSYPIHTPIQTQMATSPIQALVYP